MSGIILAFAGGTFNTIPVIGAAFGGGFFAGQINQSGTIYNLVIGPVSTAQNSSKQWKITNTATTGATSVIDGPQNTADMVADGIPTVYPAANFCNDLVVGGQTDWYMPAKNELEVCYYNLKPTTTNNSTLSGTNPNAVPARGSNYTAGTPAQTSAAAFKDTGAEDFSLVSYWSSSEFNDTDAWVQGFSNGYQNSGVGKTNNYAVRAVRRVAA